MIQLRLLRSSRYSAACWRSGWSSMPRRASSTGRARSAAEACLVAASHFLAYARKVSWKISKSPPSILSHNCLLLKLPSAIRLLASSFPCSHPCARSAASRAAADRNTQNQTRTHRGYPPGRLSISAIFVGLQTRAVLQACHRQNIHDLCLCSAYQCTKQHDIRSTKTKYCSRI